MDIQTQVQHVHVNCDVRILLNSSTALTYCCIAFKYICTRAGTKVGKQHSKNEYSKVCTCFYQCCSYLDWP